MNAERESKSYKRNGCRLRFKRLYLISVQVRYPLYPLFYYSTKLEVLCMIVSLYKYYREVIYE